MLGFRLPARDHRRLKSVAKRELRFIGDIAREGIIRYLDELDRKYLEREEVSEQRRHGISVKKEMQAIRKNNDAIKHSSPAPAPTTTSLIDHVASYIEAAADEDDAARRLARALEMIDEGAETAEEAELLTRALMARAKR